MKKIIVIIFMGLMSTNLVADQVDEMNNKLEVYKDNIEIYNGNAYKRENKDFPWQLKCTSVDKRIFHGCIEARFFDPSTRVYFDSKNDSSNEVDLFHDGNLNLSLDFVSVYLPWRLGKGEFYDSWSWGPMAGVGLSSAAQDS